MGLIKKCDKCKRYYKLDEDYQFNKVQIDNREDLTWFLCNKCTSSLMDWMKGRILSKKT